MARPSIPGDKHHQTIDIDYNNRPIDVREYIADNQAYIKLEQETSNGFYEGVIIPADRLNRVANILKTLAQAYAQAR